MSAQFPASSPGCLPPPRSRSDKAIASEHDEQMLLRVAQRAVPTTVRLLGERKTSSRFLATSSPQTETPLASSRSRAGGQPPIYGKAIAGTVGGKRPETDIPRESFGAREPTLAAASPAHLCRRGWQGQALVDRLWAFADDDAAVFNSFAVSTYLGESASCSIAMSMNARTRRGWAERLP